MIAVVCAMPSQYIPIPGYGLGSSLDTTAVAQLDSDLCSGISDLHYSHSGDGVFSDPLM